MRMLSGCGAHGYRLNQLEGVRGNAEGWCVEPLIWAVQQHAAQQLSEWACWV
jgi:hypothetical protein